MILFFIEIFFVVVMKCFHYLHCKVCIPKNIKFTFLFIYLFYFFQVSQQYFQDIQRKFIIWTVRMKIWYAFLLISVFSVLLFVLDKHDQIANIITIQETKFYHFSIFCFFCIFFSYCNIWILAVKKWWKYLSNFAMYVYNAKNLVTLHLLVYVQYSLIIKVNWQ